jgi:hypothetical protein
VQDARAARALRTNSLPQHRKVFRHVAGRGEDHLRRESGLREGLKFKDEHGYEAGTPLGIASSKIKGKAEFINFSFDVQIEGKNVPRAMDMMLHNDKNTPPVPVIQGPVIAVGGNEKPTCFMCDKEL